MQELYYEDIEGDGIPLDVSEYQLLDDNDMHEYIFPPDTFMPPGKYICYYSIYVVKQCTQRTLTLVRQLLFRTELSVVQVGC